MPSGTQNPPLTWLVGHHARLVLIMLVLETHLNYGHRYVGWPELSSRNQSDGVTKGPWRRFSSTPKSLHASRKAQEKKGEDKKKGEREVGFGATI